MMKRTTVFLCCSAALALFCAPDLAAQAAEPSSSRVVTASPHVAASFHPQHLAYDLGLGMNMSAVGLRLERSLVSVLSTYGSLDRLRFGLECPAAVGLGCADGGWRLLAGLNLRRLRDAVVQPYLGAAGGVLRWSDGRYAWSGEGHAGPELWLGRVGLRTEARVERAATPSLVLGAVFALDP